MKKLDIMVRSCNDFPYHSNKGMLSTNQICVWTFLTSQLPIFDVVLWPNCTIDKRQDRRIEWRVSMQDAPQNLVNMLTDQKWDTACDLATANQFFAFHTFSEKLQQTALLEVEMCPFMAWYCILILTDNSPFLSLFNWSQLVTDVRYHGMPVAGMDEDGRQWCGWGPCNWQKLVFVCPLFWSFVKRLNWQNTRLNGFWMSIQARNNYLVLYVIPLHKISYEQLC